MARHMLGQKLKHYRETFANLTQQELADRAKIDRSWVINIEKGHSNYSIDEFISLVTNCGVSFESFLAGLEQTNIKPEHRDFHRDLNTILNSNDDDLVNGIRVNLRAISKEAVALKAASRAAKRTAANESAGQRTGAAIPNRKKPPPKLAG